jgi:hypothetical protein
MIISSVKWGTPGKTFYFSPKFLFLGQHINPVKQQLFPLMHHQGII